MRRGRGVLLWVCALTGGAVVLAQTVGGQLSPAALDKYQNSLRADATSAQGAARKLEEQSDKLMRLLKANRPSNAALKSQVDAFNDSLTLFNMSAAAVNLNVSALRFDMELSVRKETEQSVRKELTAAFNLSTEEIDDLRKRGLNYSEIAIAHNLANLLSRTPGISLGVTPEKIYLLRESGKGWGEVFQALEVKQQHLPALGDLVAIPKPTTAHSVQPGSEKR